MCKTTLALLLHSAYASDKAIMSVVRIDENYIISAANISNRNVKDSYFLY